MTEVRVDTVPCRLCATHVARDAAVCPSCGANDPWIPEEPTINPSVIRLTMWGGGIVLVGLLLFVSGLMMFGLRAERTSATTDHRGLLPKLTIRSTRAAIRRWCGGSANARHGLLTACCARSTRRRSTA